MRVEDDAFFETQREVDWMNGRTMSMCAKIDMWRFESQAQSGVVDRSLPKLRYFTDTPPMARPLLFPEWIYYRLTWK